MTTHPVAAALTAAVTGARRLTDPLPAALAAAAADYFHARDPAAVRAVEAGYVPYWDAGGSYDFSWFNADRFVSSVAGYTLPTVGTHSAASRDEVPGAVFARLTAALPPSARYLGRGLTYQSYLTVEAAYAALGRALEDPQ